MPHTHQDETVAQPELTAAVNAPHITQREVASESTPAKKKYGPDLTFASVVTKFEKVRSQLGKEMDGRWLGAMPVDKFLDEFLRSADAPLPDLLENPFRNIPNEGAESTRYDPFIAAIQGWIPHLRAVNTSNREDTTNQLRLRTDISLYNHIEGVATPNRSDFSRMELWMEFKTKTDGVAFQDPPDTTEESRRLTIENGSFTPATVEGNKTRGQLAHYAGAQHSLQFRHFSFSVFVERDNARFLRWDPAGTVVTAAFNYRTEPRLMAEFLWRFDHLSARDRGHDESVQPANLGPEVDARVREKLEIKDENIPVYKYELPGLIGMGHAYGPRPPSENRSLVSRCTRSLPVVWIPDVEGITGDTSPSGELDSPSERDADAQTGQDTIVKKGPWSEEGIIYMKDTWRFLSNSPDVEVMPEHKIYEMLHRHETPNIPEHVAGGDVGGGRTKTQVFMDAPWLCVRQRISPFQHYRLVHGIVGRALFKFDSTKQLVTAVFDALRAHSHAFEVAKILHRDVSAGNIILTDEGRGLLIDWELAKRVDEGGSRRPDRTGTWQFMSANLLRQPGKVHTFTDDLESFLHVLGWMTLRYVPAVDFYEGDDRSNDMAIFDEYSVRPGDFDRGGRSKSNALGSEQYPSRDFRPRQPTPLAKLIRELSKPFASFYRNPPTDEDRLKMNTPPNLSDESQFLLCAAILKYDKDISCLQTSTWFLNMMQMALDEQRWPIEDKADENLPIGLSSGDTKQRLLIKTSKLQGTHKLWADSKGLSRNSKRAASPTPEPSAKRPRGTPTASESHS